MIDIMINLKNDILLFPFSILSFKFLLKKMLEVLQQFASLFAL